MMTDVGFETIQELVGKWWTETPKDRKVEPGRLAWAIVPYPDVISQGLVLEGRGDDPTNHHKALFRVEPVKGGRLPREPELPVAALPRFPGESFLAQRGKRRPVLILSEGGPDVPKAVASGSPGYLRRSCVLASPYYGVDRDGSRSGIPPMLVDRIRRIEYPQFILDSLPLPGTSQSVLRLDHTFAMGADAGNFELTSYRLEPEALEIVHDWFRWLVEGVLESDALLSMARIELT